jgi:phosphosulfolactate synthase
MNFSLNNIPNRTQKPRGKGLTMVMDKGLSTRQVEDMLEASGSYIDVVKLGFGTSFVSNNLEDKLKVYKDNGIGVYFGGTLFEAFIARNQFEDYKRLVDKYQLDYVEVSDGCMDMDHNDKCRYISELAKQATVFSEVGSKDASVEIPANKWVEMMEKELNAGSWRLIAEAREGGNVGIFDGGGEIKGDLIEEIITKVPGEKILWEAPQKSQQIWFIKLLGPNVNLGNIAPAEVIPLETLRLGLRGDTFNEFLNIDEAELAKL